MSAADLPRQWREEAARSEDDLAAMILRTCASELDDALAATGPRATVPPWAETPEAMSVAGDAADIPDADSDRRHAEQTRRTATIAERVAAGAAYLDQHQPGWVDLIDLDRLDLQGECDCILGQLHGGFWHAPAIKDAGGVEDRLQAGDPYGFSSGHAPNSEAEEAEYAALTAAWRELIQARRGAR